MTTTAELAARIVALRDQNVEALNNSQVSTNWQHFWEKHKIAANYDYLGDAPSYLQQAYDWFVRALRSYHGDPIVMGRRGKPTCAAWAYVAR